MKINGINSQIPLYYPEKKERKPSFGTAGLPLLNASGTIMQWIESKGYFVSFLIQDGLGMTLPRVWTGFNRDKKQTGKYNIQEGREVFLRESLSGPYIIAVAPAVLAVTSRFCRSTNTNTRLIKRFGESLKDMLKSPEIRESVKQNREEFRNAFIKYNIENICKDSVPVDKNSKETVEYIAEQFKNLDSKDKKIRSEALKNITDKINAKKLETSSDLFCLNKLSAGKENTKQVFNMQEVLMALRDFSSDAILNNPKQEQITVEAAENIKNNLAAKRLATNVANAAITLGGLSVIPKIYARDDVPPAAKTLALKEQKNNLQTDNNSNTVSFQARGINSDGFWAKTGKYITKHVSEKMQELLEYTGYNFSKTTFAGLAVLGIILPRCKRALERMQIDKDGKRDMTEICEIVLRDTVSILSVVFAVPCLTKMIVRSYENKTGFILTNRASDGKNVFKKTTDILWPYSKLEVLSMADLDAIYGNINSKPKLMNFAKFVSGKGGDLAKILSKSENADLLFNEKSFTLDSLNSLTLKEKNDKIISEFEKLNNADEIITKVMQETRGNNLITKIPRGLNSVPGVISTVLISPIILGVLLPKLTYYITRMQHEKKLERSSVA